MSECPFCGLDPFEWVDVGVGSIPIAVNCCPLGPSLYEHYADATARAIAKGIVDALGDMPHGEERFAKAMELMEQSERSKP